MRRPPPRQHDWARGLARRCGPAAQMKFVEQDLKKFGSKEGRTRLMGRWEREVQAAAEVGIGYGPGPAP